jgi:putative PIN family toxin of toxin-antitoxin system
MRLIVLDTNVIISAGIKPGSPPADLVMNWVLEGRVQVVTSPFILHEYREVARRAKFRRYGFPPLWLEWIIEESLYLPDADIESHPGSNLPDSKDKPFLALAHDAGAWLVTGNLKHFPRLERKNVTVLSPADYLMHLLEGSR